MCRSYRAPSGTALILLSLIAVGSPATAQVTVARVLDDATRQPLVGAKVAVFANDSLERVVTTNSAGFFELRLEPGRYVVEINSEGYLPQRRSLDLPSTAPVPAFLLRRDIVPLEPVEARAQAQRTERGRTVARPSHLLSGERLARLERASVSAAGAIRELGAGLQVRERPPRGLCVQSARRIASFNAAPGTCEMVAVVVNGVVVQNGPQILANMRVAEWESIEYVPPILAGQLYGMDAGAFGAIVLWSRGFGPHRDPERNSGGDG
jgi:hypothetical protein